MRFQCAVLSVCLAATVAAGAQAKKDGGSASDAITAADRAWLKAFQARAIDKSAAFIAPDGAMYPPNGPAAADPAAIKQLISGLLGMKDLKFSWTPTKVMAASSGDLGFSSGTYEMTFTDNGKPVHDKGKYVTVWKKQTDGSWKVVRDIFNSDLNPAAAH